MTPEDYNDHQAGRLWSIHDLPASVLETALRDGVRSDRFTAAVRRIQAEHGLTPDGRLGPRTWAAIQAIQGQGKDTGTPEIQPTKTQPTKSQLDETRAASSPDVLIRVGSVAFLRPAQPEAPPSSLISGSAGGSSMAALWNRYGGGIETLAAEFRLPVGAALAVFLTEAGRSAYDPDTGLVMIRFEAHLFQRKMGQSGRKMKHDGRQSTEWEALAAAANRDLYQAFSCTSFGLPQIMGFNCRSVGYNSPVTMALDFQDNVTAQIKGFFAFCRHHGLDHFIRQKDWRSFTRRYNGPGQVDHYAGVLTRNINLARHMGFDV